MLDMELRRGTPTELNRWLLDGELDISPISSVEYLRHADDLLLLPDLTVSSDGPVKSIALVSRVPLAALGGKTVALTSMSATSQVLTRIVLSQGYGLEARYIERPPDLERMLDEADAALLIGDSALRVLWQPPVGLRCYDLGDQWRSLTGHAMVYAVWAVRRDYVVRAPELVSDVGESFRRSLDYSVAHVDEIAAAASRWEPFPAALLADYFQTLQFTFGPRHQIGLLEFARRAVLQGALHHVPDLEFFAPASSTYAAS